MQLEVFGDESQSANLGVGDDVDKVLPGYGSTLQ